MLSEGSSLDSSFRNIFDFITANKMKKATPNMTTNLIISVNNLCLPFAFLVLSFAGGDDDSSVGTWSYLLFFDSSFGLAINVSSSKGLSVTLILSSNLASISSTHWGLRFLLVDIIHRITL